jgi:hypothetical protein
MQSCFGGFEWFRSVLGRFFDMIGKFLERVMEDPCLNPLLASTFTPKPTPKLLVSPS